MVSEGRYIKTRGDLMVSIALVDKDVPATRKYAERVRDALRSAREELEGANPNLPVTANLLALADRSLVWLYPRDVLEQRCNLARDQLQRMQPQPTALISELAHRDDLKHTSRQGLVSRYALAEALTYINAASETTLIEDDLQVARLSVVRRYLWMALLLIIAAVPFTTEAKYDESTLDLLWPVFELPRVSMEFSITAAALALGAVGAVGATISGMFRVRDSRARINEFRTSMLNFSLRPLAGAIAAVSLYLLLAWEVLNGIEVTSPGVYVLVAFLAGFSERYFLRVIRAEEQPAKQQKAAADG